MKKYFAYEFKKNLLPIVVMTCIATIIFAVSAISSTLIYKGDNNYVSTGSSLVWFPLFLILALCTIIPIRTYSFKMQRRCVDEFYSLPIKREKLYLVKSLVGLCEVFIPYFVSFWVGFCIIALRENIFNMAMYVPLFFISVLLGVVIFGINGFAFTRANNVFDGLVFIGFFMTALILPAIYILQFTSFTLDILIGFSGLSSYIPMILSFITFDSLITGSQLFSFGITGIIAIVISTIIGIACWFGLFFSQRFEKAENAGQISTSWFGYKVYLPLALCATVACTIFHALVVTSYITAIISAIIGNIVYRRTFKLPARDLIILAAAFALGLLLSGLATLRFPSDLPTYPTW